MSLQITAVYTALLALLMLLLAYVVVKQRLAGVPAADDLEGSARFESIVRAHGNAAEYIPISLLLLAALENSVDSAALVHGFGLLILLSRIGHGYGMVTTVGRSAGRFYGTIGSWLYLLAASVAVLLGQAGII
jgi:uncharacterized membrane protein YecN with MAPEG domain